MTSIKLGTSEYNLACNLRVAYVLQNQHNHKPYTQIMSSIDSMTLEEQINVLYAAFSVGNPEAAKNYSADMFRSYLLDDPEFNIAEMMHLIRDVFSGILGRSLDDEDASKPIDGDEKN